MLNIGSEIGCFYNPGVFYFSKQELKDPLNYICTSISLVEKTRTRTPNIISQLLLPLVTSYDHHFSFII